LDFRPSIFDCTYREQACNPDFPADVESSQVIENQSAVIVNEVSFGGVGRVPVTLLSQFLDALQAQCVASEDVA
jgi:hypothetical protein